MRKHDKKEFMNQNSPNQSEEISLRDLVQTVLDARKAIIGAAFVSIILSLIICYTSPVVYQSTSKLMVKSGQDGTNYQLSGIAALAGIKLGASGSSSPSAYLAEVIRDSEFLKKLIEKKWVYKGDSLLLEEIWGMAPDTTVKNWEYRYFMQRINKLRGPAIELSQDKKNGLLTLVTSFHNPSMAFQLNKQILFLIDEYIKSTLKSQAKENKVFIGQRIAEAKRDLRKSENELAHFRAKNIDVRAPMLLLEQERLMRNVTINQEIYIQLMKQYELAQIEEKKDQTLIEIVNSPEIPLRRSKPNKRMIVMIGVFFGSFVGFVFHVVWNWLIRNFNDS